MNGLPEGKLSDAHGTLLATIIATVGDRIFESPPVWIIQEDRLTHEPGDGSSSSRGIIKETGEGLPEYLDEIGGREGAKTIADFLRQLDSRFFDGGSGGQGARRFRVRITDPFESDKMPDWLIQTKGEAEDLCEAITEFVERHHKRKLLKHSSRGNINGMENFLDILTTLVRLLYLYNKRSIVVRGIRRDVVFRGVLIGWLCTWIQLTTTGASGSARRTATGIRRQCCGLHRTQFLPSGSRTWPDETVAITITSGSLREPKNEGVRPSTDIDYYLGTSPSSGAAKLAAIRKMLKM